MADPATLGDVWAKPGEPRLQGGLTALHRAWGRVIGSPQTERAERDAECCMAMFLAAALGPKGSGGEHPATVLFALGALDAAAERAGLGRVSHWSLESRLIRRLSGCGRLGLDSQRRRLRNLERSETGRVIRQRGEEALRSWMRGESPARRLAAAVRGV